MAPVSAIVRSAMDLDIEGVVCAVDPDTELVAAYTVAIWTAFPAWADMNFVCVPLPAGALTVRELAPIAELRALLIAPIVNNSLLFGIFYSKNT